MLLLPPSYFVLFLRLYSSVPVLACAAKAALISNNCSIVLKLPEYYALECIALDYLLVFLTSQRIGSSFLLLPSLLSIALR